MEHSYYLTFRTRKKGSEMSFNVGTKEKTTTLLKLRAAVPKTYSTKSSKL